MFAILAVVLFAVALVLDIADANVDFAFVTAGLLCLALHLCGLLTSTPTWKRS